MAVTNLFKPLTAENGEIYVFSTYADDLTRQNTSPEEYRVVPSKFAALNINPPDITGGEIGVNTGTVFQDYYENALAFYRNMDWEEDNPWRFRKYWANRLLWATMMKYGMITDETYNTATYIGPDPSDPNDNTPNNGQLNNDNDAEIHYFPQLHYIGDINIYSTQKHDGVNYNEIYCYIPSDARDTYYSTYVALPTDASHDDSDVQYPYDIAGVKLVGWTDENYPANNPIANSAEVDNDTVTPPLLITYDSDTWYRPDELEPGDLREGDEHHAVNKVWDPTEADPEHGDTYHNMFNVNCIVLFYDIKTIDDNGNIITKYKNIPMGVYFTGVNGTDSYSNVVEKYVSHSDIHGQGSSYALRVCNRYATTPNATVFLDSITDVYDGAAALSDVMSGFGEVIDTMNDVIAENQTFRNEVSDHLALFKNYRTNVPYIRNIKDVYSGQTMGYWFVNGRNTGQPAGQYTIANVSTQANWTEPDTTSPAYIRNRPLFGAEWDNVNTDPSVEYYTVTDPDTHEVVECGYNVKIPKVLASTNITLDPRTYQGTPYSSIQLVGNTLIGTVPGWPETVVSRGGNWMDLNGVRLQYNSSNQLQLNIPNIPAIEIQYTSASSPSANYIGGNSNKYSISIPNPQTAGTGGMSVHGLYTDDFPGATLDINVYNGQRASLLAAIGARPSGSFSHFTVYNTNSITGDSDEYKNIENRIETAFPDMWSYGIMYRNIEERFFADIINRMKINTRISILFVPNVDKKAVLDMGYFLPFEINENLMWQYIRGIQLSGDGTLEMIHFAGNFTRVTYKGVGDKYIVPVSYYENSVWSDKEDNPMAMHPMYRFDIYKGIIGGSKANARIGVEVYITDYNMRHYCDYSSGKLWGEMWDSNQIERPDWADYLDTGYSPNNSYISNLSDFE